MLAALVPSKENNRMSGNALSHQPIVCRRCESVWLLQLRDLFELGGRGERGSTEMLRSEKLVNLTEEWDLNRWLWSVSMSATSHPLSVSLLTCSSFARLVFLCPHPVLQHFFLIRH